MEKQETTGGADRQGFRASRLKSREGRLFAPIAIGAASFRLKMKKDYKLKNL